jgi:hypothetical protein
MIFSFSDALEIPMILVSLSVFKLRSTPTFLSFFPIYFLGDFILGLYQEFTSNKGIYNTGVTNACLIAEFSFICFVLRGFIVNQLMRKVILVLIFIIAFFSIINLVFIQKKVGLNPINFTIQSLITIVLCIYYYFELFQRIEVPSLSGLPSFWITTAILFNTALTFPMSAFMSFMQQWTKQNDASFRIIIRNITTIFNIIITITYVLYSIGFLCMIKTKKYTL